MPSNNSIVTDDKLLSRIMEMNRAGQIRPASEIIPDYNSAPQAEMRSSEPDWREQSQTWLTKNTPLSPRAAGNITGGPQGDLAGVGVADLPNTTGAAAAYKDWAQDPSYLNSLGLTASVVPGAGAAKAIFAGVMAKTANKEKLAEYLAKKGRSLTAREETGWFSGSDNKPRFEITDHRSSVEPFLDNVIKPYNPNDIVKYMGGGYVPLSAVFRHNQLYKAYPDMKTTMVFEYVPKSAEDKTLGGVDPTSGVLYIRKGLSPQMQREVLLHEIQHLIQKEEGFAFGSLGNNKIAGGGDEYFRSAGEVEARNVQRRRDMTDKERIASSPLETEDVPLFRQIVKFNAKDIAESRDISNINKPKNIFEYAKQLISKKENVNPNDIPLKGSNDFNTRYTPRQEPSRTELGQAVKEYIDEVQKADTGKAMGDYLDLFDIRNMDLHLSKANDGTDPVKYTDIIAGVNKDILRDNKVPSGYDRALIGRQVQKAHDEEYAAGAAIREEVERALRKFKKDDNGRKE